MSSPTKTQSNLTELAFAVLLLSVLALLTANIGVFLIASRHNDEMCRRVTIAAAKAAVDGVDEKGVLTLARQELVQNGYGGFFIDPPKMTSFSDVTKNNKRRLKVVTECLARIPVPNLVFSEEVKKGWWLKRAYVVEIGLAPEDQPKSKSESENKENSDDASE